MTPEQYQVAFFWLSVALAMMFTASIWVMWHYQALHQRRKELTWDVHSEYIDIEDFSNRNIPLKISYKGTEPRCLWATYLSLSNTGTEDVRSSEAPERQDLIIGAPGCRYIGFNKLISKKAKAVMSPLFRGEDVYCKLEFDCLGPGDEILVSLLFVADEQHRVEVEGGLFGSRSRVLDGYQRRMSNWRSLWWLVLAVIASGSMAGWSVYAYITDRSHILLYQLAAIMLIYSLGLATAAVLLRPVYNWRQMLDRFGGTAQRRSNTLKQLRYLFFLEREM